MATQNTTTQAGQEDLRDPNTKRINSSRTVIYVVILVAIILIVGTLVFSALNPDKAKRGTESMGAQDTQTDQSPSSPQPAPSQNQ